MDFQKMTESKLDLMFNPASIAVVGASKDPMKWGAIILKHIVEGGYGGKIFPINPKEESIQGLKTYPSVLEVPGRIDLAVIAVPAPTVPSIIADCVDKEVETAVIISSGFGETGESGKEAEEELTSIARMGGLRFAGPNCMGIFSARANLCALMPNVKPLEGNVSFISQSGNLGVQILQRGSLLGLGFDMFVSSGNEADLKCEDYVEYFKENSSIEVTLAYLEGVKYGKKFFEVARSATEENPLIVFKSGETEAGKSAAMSHTGALGGSMKVYNGVFKQTGIIRAETTDDMLNFASAFSQPLPENDELAILTRGGGWGVVAADACNNCGIKTPQPPPDIIEELDEVLPPYWSRGNPIDSVASRDGSAWFKILGTVKRWSVGGALILGGIGEYFIGSAADMGVSEEIGIRFCTKFAEGIIELSKIKPVFTVAFSPMDESEPVKLLRKNKIPVYYDPQTAVRSYSKLIEYKNFLEKRNKIHS